MIQPIPFSRDVGETDRFLEALRKRVNEQGVNRYDVPVGGQQSFTVTGMSITDNTICFVDGVETEFTQTDAKTIDMGSPLASGQRLVILTS